MGEIRDAVRERIEDERQLEAVQIAKGTFRAEYRNMVAAKAKVDSAQGALESRKASLYAARLALRRLGVSEDEAWG